MGSLTDKPLRLVDAGPLDIHHQVALDAAQLELVNRGEVPPCWRFWEADAIAVVLGTGCAAHKEVYIERLRADSVPLVRRTSGGGAVVQGPGVLNFTAVLRIDDPRDQVNIAGSYREVLEVVIAALGDLGAKARFEPPSDLAVAQQKISGSAQARKRRAVMVHGTVLVSADTALFGRYLPHPPAEPAYRAGRAHEAFVTTLHQLGVSVTCGQLTAQIACRAGLDPEHPQPSRERELVEARALVRKKFSRDAWTLRK
jgi:lipoate-protein ligase A